MLCDARLHPAGLTDQDLETLRFFGVTHVVAMAETTLPTTTPATLEEALRRLVKRQRPRLERQGISARFALGVHPATLPGRGLSQVLEQIPALAHKESVVALGLTGLSTGSLDEEDAVRAHLELADHLGLPVVLTSPARDREVMTRQLLRLVQRLDVEPGRLLIDGATTRTAGVIRELGCWVGLTLHPDHLTVEKAADIVAALGSERLVLSSAAGDGASDLLSVPRARNLLAQRLSRGVVTRVTWSNAQRFFGLPLTTAKP
jgi:hypothetical protein